MEDRNYYIKLFDIYKNLLTEHNKLIFSYYFEEDLSLSEIADNESVSKAAISKTIKNTINKLESLEKNLKIYSERQEIIKLIQNKDYDKLKKYLD